MFDEDCNALSPSQQQRASKNHSDDREITPPCCKLADTKKRTMSNLNSVQPHRNASMASERSAPHPRVESCPFAFQLIFDISFER